MSIQDIADAAAGVAASQTRLREAVRITHAEGVAITDIANAAHVGRQTIYRWLDEDTERVNVESTLRAGLEVLSYAVPPYTSEKVLAALSNGGLGPMINATLLGTKNLQPAAEQALTDSERRNVRHAASVASRAKLAHSETGKYPKTLAMMETTP